MAIIYSYPAIDEVQGSDLILVADASKQNQTKSASVNQLFGDIFSGDDNYIPRFNVTSGSTTLENSVIYQDNDGHVSIGVTGTPPATTHTLKVNGTSQFTDAVTLNNSDIKQTTSQLDLIVGSLEDSMLELNADSGDWSWRIGENTSVTTIEGASSSGNIDITSVGAVMARFNGSTPTDSFIKLGGSGAANKLDDYEEGTFTPTLVTTGTETNPITKQGRYTKIGNLVTVTIMLSVTVNESETLSIVECSNLPFTIRNEASFSGIRLRGVAEYDNAITDAFEVYSEGLEGTLRLFFRKGSSSIALNDDDDNLVMAQITYEVE